MPTKPIQTLVLDTSGRFTTAILVRDGEATACASYRIQPLSHLHATIRELLGRVALDLSDIDRLAVVTGPGSWTGLNIGVTAAKTLAQVLQLPLIELPSLDALVVAESWLGGAVYGILDAKRNNVYCGTYTTDERGSVELGGTQLELISWDELQARLSAETNRPLVIEYGNVFRSRIESELPRACVLSRDRLSEAGLVETLNARQDNPLDLEGVMGLSPLYLQKALGA